jgi:hypothetical protein
VISLLLFFQIEHSAQNKPLPSFQKTDKQEKYRMGVSSITSGFSTSSFFSYFTSEREQKKGG